MFSAACRARDGVVRIDYFPSFLYENREGEKKTTKKWMAGHAPHFSFWHTPPHKKIDFWCFHFAQLVATGPHFVMIYFPFQ